MKAGRSKPSRVLRFVSVWFLVGRKNGAEVILDVCLKRPDARALALRGDVVRSGFAGVGLSNRASVAPRSRKGRS